MHTFFVNTSASVSLEAYKEILFEELLVSKQLIIPGQAIPLDGLGGCARDIARRIDQEADITEETTLIVYLEDSHGPASSLDARCPHLVAEETLLSLKAEEALMRQLRALGKHPRTLAFIFGERVKRDPALEFDQLFRSEINQSMWARIQLPPCSALLKTIQDLLEKKDQAGQPLTEEDLMPALAQGSAQDAILSQRDEGCYPAILKSLAQMIVYHFDHDTQSVTESTLYTCLGSALEEYTRSLRQDPAMEQSALSVQYHYLPLEDCDVHERHRSVCRLLLFVYALAADGNMPGFFDMSRQAQAGRLQQNDLGPLHACLVPEMDRQRLGQTLLLRLERCQGAAYQQAELPPELSKQEGRQKEARIRSEYAVPTLVPKSLDIPRERRESPGASMAEALTRRALRLEELKNAVQRTLAAVLEKNSRNQQDIAEYLNRVGSEYNRSKDEALRQFVSQGSVPALQAFQGQNADQYIDELQNIQDRMGEEKKRLEKAILQAPRRLVTTADMTRAVQAVEKQTDYYFRALRVGWTLALSGVGFVLLFLVPYAAIARQLFSSPLGYLFFPLTALGLSGACIAGFAQFSRACKRKIIRMVRQLVDDFAASQKNNQDCLEQFGEFLYRSIPQYCALCQYEETLRQYKTALQQRREQITYHNTSRERQSARIRKLLDDLDIVSVPQKPAALPETFLINPEADRIANRDVYLLSAQNVRDILGIAPKRSQEA